MFRKFLSHTLCAFIGIIFAVISAVILYAFTELDMTVGEKIMGSIHSALVWVLQIIPFGDVLIDTVTINLTPERYIEFGAVVITSNVVCAMFLGCCAHCLKQ